MTRTLISTQQLGYEDLLEIWRRSTSLSLADPPSLGSSVVLLFESPSTRTKFGFEQAALELGAQTISLDSNGSRLASGESLRDSLDTVSQMSDQILVVRTRASLDRLQLPATRVVNAGDADEHPTQALVDLFTIATLIGQPLNKIRDFTIYCCAGRGAPLRPIVSLCWLLQTLGRGEVILYSELPLEDLQLPRLRIVDDWSLPHDHTTAFGYVLESFDAQGNIQPSPWVRKRLLEMANLPTLHPLPRLEAKNLVIRDSDPTNPVSTQLRLQVPVKKSALLWMESRD